MGIVDLNARKWAADNRVEAHAPRAALVEMLRQIDAGEIAPRHVVICYAEPGEEAPVSGWLQAGDANALEQRGMLAGLIIEMFDQGRIA